MSVYSSLVPFLDFPCKPIYYFAFQDKGLSALWKLNISQMESLNSFEKDLYYYESLLNILATSGHCGLFSKSRIARSNISMLFTRGLASQDTFNQETPSIYGRGRPRAGKGKQETIPCTPCAWFRSADFDISFFPQMLH